jgi:hypothetical protein
LSIENTLFYETGYALKTGCPANYSAGNIGTVLSRVKSEIARRVMRFQGSEKSAATPGGM